MMRSDVLIDLSPLKESRAFRYAYAARTATVLVTGMLLVASSIQLYGLTQSSVAVAMLNLLLAVPMGIALIIGGVLADRMDRKTLMIRSRSVYVLSTLIFLGNSMMPEPAVWPIYVAAIIGGSASGISIPAMMSATPALVGKEKLVAAAALSGLAMHLGSVFGPLLAGVLINGPGLVACYAVVLLGVAITPLLLRALPPLPPLPRRPAGAADRHSQATSPADAKPGILHDFTEGVRYMLDTPLLRNLLLIDLAAVFFATPLALLPEWGTQVLAQGAQATGALYSAPAVGAVIMALASGWTRAHPQPGRLVIAAVITWGAAILALSMTRNLYLSMAALAVMGAADTLSKMMRMALVQKNTPNHLLGRMSSLWMTQSSLGTAAGNMQMGIVSRFFGPATAFFVGGSLCLLSGLAFRLRANPLREYVQQAPESPAPGATNSP